MEIGKNDVQCISFTKDVHPIHKAWMNEVSSRKILTYIPENMFWTKRFSILSQFVALIKGFFIPSAKVYLIEASAIVPCILFKKGKVICINSDTFFHNMEKSSLVRFYSRLLLKRIDGYISSSKMMHEKATDYKKKSEIVYPFIDDKNSRLFKINPNFDNENICLIGGELYIKGIDFALDAFKEYKEAHPDSRFYVLGKDRSWDSDINGAGATATGLVDVYDYLKKCSLHINPARHESFGVNIIEAMAAGIPPIISKYCGAKELIEKVDKKLIIDLDSEELYERMMWLKSNKERYMRYSRKCKELAKPFTKKRSTSEFKDKFHRLLERT